MDERTELAWLRERVGGLERALFAARRELFDCRARLALIARIVADRQPPPRRHGAVLGAVRAALYSRPQNGGLTKRFRDT